MANSFTVQVKGLREFGANIKTMNNKMGTKIIRAAVVAGANVIVRAAKVNAPVKTGALKKSIGSRRDANNSKVGYETRAVSVFKVSGVYGNTPKNVKKGRVGKKYLMDPPTFYWKFNELGTVKQPARPFIEPALANNVQTVTTAMSKRLKKGIDEAL